MESEDVRRSSICVIMKLTWVAAGGASYESCLRPRSRAQAHSPRRPHCGSYRGQRRVGTSRVGATGIYRCNPSVHPVS